MVLGLFVTEVVKLLQDEELEHQDKVIERAAATFFGLLGENFLEFWTESFPVDEFVQTGKSIPKY